LFDVRTYTDDYIRVLRRLDQAVVARMAEAVLGAWIEGCTVFLCGNGGSAASASHIAADLTKLTAPRRGPRLRAVALNDSVSAMSAIANDLAYDQVFAEQLRAFLSPRDVLIGLSTSGSSANVLRAIEYANIAGGITIGMTGQSGTQLQSRAWLTLVVPSASVQQVEDASMVAGHVICLMVKEMIAQAREQARLRPVVAPAAVSRPLPPGSPT
jgi:D-sedoheptulose 7-phosphate isomerase